MTPRSMAVIQVITATTLNPSPDRKEAVGKDTKWNGKLSEPPRAPLSWISALAVKLVSPPASVTFRSSRTWRSVQRVRTEP